MYKNTPISHSLRVRKLTHQFSSVILSANWDNQQYDKKKKGIVSTQ